jgi:hypothetical protein
MDLPVVPATATLTCAALAPLSLLCIGVCLLSPIRRWDGLYALLTGIMGGLVSITLASCYFVSFGDNLGPRPWLCRDLALSFVAGFGLLSALSIAKAVHEELSSRSDHG